MKTHNLTSLLENIESTLSDFVYDELNTEDAAFFKKSFQNFKEALFAKINRNKTNLNISHITKAQKEHFQAPVNESNLIANVSHEIRTPLNGIIGFTDLLKESPLKANQLSNVNAIQTASYSLLELVNELLEYSKLASGNEQFQKVEFNIFSLVKDVLFLCNTLITNKNVVLTSAIDQRIPEILIGDPSKLTQVLLNIIGNAIKFVEKGEVNLHVSFSKKKDQKYHLIFKIKDDGIGIAKDKLAQIFDPFKQVDANTAVKYGGTGLGLSIVKQIIENLNGSISVKSKQGEGSTFKFIIPYEKSAQKLKLNPSFIPDKAPLDTKLVAGLNILVFEDNELNQRLIEQRLKMWKCDLSITDNPDEGLKILENNRIDLVLMDLRMPIMSGFDIAKLIRKNKSNSIRKIPIIALTADYSVQDQEKCAKSGINDYLLKPFSPEQLLTKIVAYKNKPSTTRTIAKTTLNSKKNTKSNKPIVNLSGVYEDSGYDMVILKELVFLFRQNLSEFIADAEMQLRNRAVEGLLFSAHKIKAGVLLFQAPNLLNTITNLQFECSATPDFKHLEYLHARFVKDFDAIDKILDSSITDLKRN